MAYRFARPLFTVERCATCKKQITFRNGGYRGARYGVLAEEETPKVMSRRQWYCAEHYIEMRKNQRENGIARAKAESDGGRCVPEKIGRMFHRFGEAIEAEGITDAEMERFRAWCGRQEAIGPLLDPTLYSMGGGFNMLDVVKERVEVLGQLRAVLARGTGG